jgi:hypothetical protein
MSQKRYLPPKKRNLVNFGVFTFVIKRGTLARGVGEDHLGVFRRIDTVRCFWLLGVWVFGDMVIWPLGACAVFAVFAVFCGVARGSR